jgi:hypothetical protein
MNSFDVELYRSKLMDLETQELEFLSDLYTHVYPKEYKQQIELIAAELEFRKTPLAKELY